MLLSENAMGDSCTKMKESNIYLHIGHGKTGSSAVQSALALAKDSLLSLGIYYPIDSSVQSKASKFGITSGNWSHIPEQSLGRELTNLLKSTTHNSSLLLSSEHLFWHMDSLFNDGNIDLDRINLHVILAVRDLEEMLSSEYQQLVKRHGETRPFELFLHSRGFVSSHHRRASQLLKALSHHGIKTTVINYSKRKSRIAEDVFEVIGAKDAYPSSKMEGVVINRSLTRKELQILKLINTIYFEKYPAIGVRISDALIKAFPNFYPQKLRLSVESKEKLYKLNLPYIESINLHLPKEDFLFIPEAFQDSNCAAKDVREDIIVPDQQIMEEEKSSIDIIGKALQAALQYEVGREKQRKTRLKIKDKMSNKKLSKKLVDRLVKLSQSSGIDPDLRVEILELASVNRPKRKRLARLLEEARFDLPTE
jgi:hypothetical protein